ncbi:hypothetical protein KZ287_30905, partial [Escherichia coli]|nr:hypothetical protein [Escherichia coli]
SGQVEQLRERCASRRLPMKVVPERIYRIQVNTGDVAAAQRPAYADTDELTWGLQAVKAVESGYTGAGVKVAVLDTGFDENHPDFAG